MFNNTKVLVTGGSGMIGRCLIQLLLKEGADVNVVSLDKENLAPPGVKYRKGDLTDQRICMESCEGMDYVFHLAGIKGSPRMTVERPASFMVPMMQFNLNMMESAWRHKVKRYLYTSSIGVYHPAPVLKEDDVWKTFPSANDRFAGWAKRMGELQAQAYELEHGWDQIVVVRPANVYGRHDTFDPECGAMVVPSLILRAMSGDDPLVVWGDGSAMRDFIHAEDVAKGILHMMKINPSEPVNLGSGVGVSIRDLITTILKVTGLNPKVVWDTSKPIGDTFRILDSTRAKGLGWSPEMSLEDGIADTCSWFEKNKELAMSRYSVFKEK